MHQLGVDPGLERHKKH